MNSFSPTFFGPSFRIHNHSLLSPLSPLFSLPLSSLFLCHLVLDLSAKGVWKPAFLGNKWGWKMVVSPLSVQTVTYLSLFSKMFHSAVLVSPWIRAFLVQPLQMVNLQSSSRLLGGGMSAVSIWLLSFSAFPGFRNTDHPLKTLKAEKPKLCAYLLSILKNCDLYHPRLLLPLLFDKHLCTFIFYFTGALGKSRDKHLFHPPCFTGRLSTMIFISAGTFLK